MTPAPDNAAALSLAAAERAFAAQSMRSDMVSAFVANFADDGVLVTNGWTRAKTALAGKPPPPVDLDWAPAHVEVAASGELGLSTGPSIRKSRTHPEAAPSYGHFVSVWRRSPEGRWQVEVDLGISHPQAFALPGEAAVAPTAALADPAETLDQAEARFEQICAREGARAAFEASALPRFMLYRPAHAPVQGKAAALASPLLDTTRIAWRAEKVVASRPLSREMLRISPTPDRPSSVQTRT